MLDEAVIAVTTLGDGVVVLSVAGFLALLFLYAKRYRAALLVGLGVGGGLAIGAALKLLIGRERPPVDGRLIEVSNYSMPSIHALGSAALAVCLVALLWRSKYQKQAMIGMGLYVAMIGASRVYLGVHYWTDVLAGWFVAFVWVYVVARCLHYDAGDKA